ncbi:carboxylesterase/lipase family protein [Streptomyces sp. NPDC059783]|uniref:carboxylesterase/lipase family protein n=1 Tax=Streptomyces sp. NPDC059783 TaxID=3346944 RepID=UPI0036658516
MFETVAGRVRGRAPHRGAVAVLGIPYAEPPFGDNRLAAPRARRPWTGVRDCTRFGPVPPQSAELPGAPVWSPGDEDVLSLNVWTPEPAVRAGAGPLPVLVWIHGGAYTFGSSAQPDFDGTVPARAGTVVVTLNYRLGFEGFGHVPDDGDGLHPPNRGLLDQIAALEWVRDNIAAFGGAPDRVTVAGQSAGATSVACLMVMDGARGLFRRAVAHSAVGPVFAPGPAEELTLRIAGAAGVPATAAGLAAASPQTLVRAADAVVDGYRNAPGTGPLSWDPVVFGPVADGRVLRADPVELIGSGEAPDIDLLVCHTTQEYWLFDAVNSLAPVADHGELSGFAHDLGLPGSLVEGYRRLLPSASPRELQLALYGDLSFGEYGNRLADAHARAGGRTFLSRFARQRGGEAPVYAWHCADVPFVFGTLDEESVHFLIGGPPTEDDRRLSARMRAAWAGFAADGDPGWRPKGDPEETVRIWGTPDPAAGPDPWRDGDRVRGLWSSYAYGPAAP